MEKTFPYEQAKPAAPDAGPAFNLHVALCPFNPRILANRRPQTHVKPAAITAGAAAGETWLASGLSLVATTLTSVVADATALDDNDNDADDGTACEVAGGDGAPGVAC